LLLTQEQPAITLVPQGEAARRTLNGEFLMATDEPLKEYVVVLRIPVEARNPRQAVRIADGLIKDPEATWGMRVHSDWDESDPGIFIDTVEVDESDD
jgi:hypothetical protein